MYINYYLQNWKECQKLCNTIGKTGLFRRVKEFHLEDVHPEIAARGRRILSKHRLDDVKDTSLGAGTFYDWVRASVSSINAIVVELIYF